MIKTIRFLRFFFFLNIKLFNLINKKMCMILVINIEHKIIDCMAIKHVTNNIKY